MEFRLAKIEEIDEVLKLHSKYQIDTIKEEDKKDGFVTTSFTKEQMKSLILFDFRRRGTFYSNSK